MGEVDVEWTLEMDMEDVELLRVRTSSEFFRLSVGFLSFSVELVESLSGASVESLLVICDSMVLSDRGAD